MSHNVSFTHSEPNLNFSLTNNQRNQPPKTVTRQNGFEAAYMPERWAKTVQRIQIAQSFTRKVQSNASLGKHSEGIVLSASLGNVPSHADSSRIRRGHPSQCFTDSFNPGWERSRISDGQPQDLREDLSWRKLHTSKEKLKSSSTTSEILAGFALITMVELQINYPTNVPEWLFILFAMNTTIAVSLNIFAIMISNYILPIIEVTTKSGNPAESPHEKMKNFIEVAWILSNILGLFLFMIQLTILLWVKYWDFTINAPISAMVIIIPFMMVFLAFSLYFYRTLVAIKCENSMDEVKELEQISHQLDSVLVT